MQSPGFCQRIKLPIRINYSFPNAVELLYSIQAKGGLLKIGRKSLILAACVSGGQRWALEIKADGSAPVTLATIGKGNGEESRQDRVWLIFDGIR